MRRTLGVVTTSRADYGIYRPLLKGIIEDPELNLHLMVGGMHLSSEFGLTVDEIAADGFPVGEKIESLLSSDTPEGIAKSMGLTTIGFSQAFARFRPDLLIVLGDRFEMLAAVSAALPFRIPIAHLFGGESTEGLIDEAVRHAISKMSHLHFVAMEHYARHVIQMGEEPWRVTVCGALSLDNLEQMELLSWEEIKKAVPVPEGSRPLLVTFHPVTLESGKTRQHVTELLDALEAVAIPLIFTYPNADTEGRIIIRAIEDYARHHPQAVVIAHMGTQLYFSLMRCAQAMVGNSSSGIVEAASFGLSVLNIGNRQKGRYHGPNVLDVPCEKEAIVSGIKNIISPEFRRRFIALDNPYGNGRAADKILQRLKTVEPEEALMGKKFYEGPVEIQ